MDLANWTTLLNLCLLAATEWIGFYLVTRSIRSLTSWLAALTLWSLSAFFLYRALTINMSNMESFGWLWAAVILALPLWFHLSTLLLPSMHGRVDVWYHLNRAAVPLFYIWGAVLVVLAATSDFVLLRIPSNAPMYTNYRLPGPLYPVFILFVLVCGAFIGRNIWFAWRHTADPALRDSVRLLAGATVAATIAGFYFVIDTQFELGLPTLFGDVCFGIAVILLGVAIARYAALLEGRPIERDFTYTALVVGSLTIFYALIMFVLAVSGAVSFVAIALTLVGTVAANSLLDGARVTLDRIFYQGQYLTLRSNLRTLADQAGTAKTLPERCQAILNALCHTLQIQNAFIAIEEPAGFTVSAVYGMNMPAHPFSRPTLEAREIIGIPPGTRQELSGMQLLLPLVARDAQVGSIVLGKRNNNANYDERDIELLEDLSDQLANIVHEIAAQQENVQVLNSMVEEFRERERSLQLEVQRLLSESAPASGVVLAEWNEENLTPLVEDALRHLNETPYLGEMELARLRVVQAELTRRKPDAETFVERGKAVHQVLLDALNQLKPDTPLPRGDQPPPREWHLYLILFDSYVRDIPNRDVMSKLYIGEGTFNRTRRRALRALAKALAEMEERA